MTTASEEARIAAARERVVNIGLRPWMALVAAGLVAAACILGGIALAESVIAARWPAGDVSPAAADALYTLAIFAPMLVAALVGGRLMRSAGMGVGLRRDRLTLIALLMGAGGLLGAICYAALAGAASMGPAAGATVSMLLAGTLLILVQSAAEEVLLRGWLQPILAERWSIWIAILVSAGLFSALHLLGGARTPMSILNMMLGGILFGLLAHKTGGLAAPIAAHFAWNWSEARLMGLDVNPGVGSFGSLFDVDLMGPAIWGGSDEGLNASVAMTVVLVALIVPLATRMRKTG